MTLFPKILKSKHIKKSTYTEIELQNHDDFMKNLEVDISTASENDRDKIRNNISELYWKYKDEI